MDSVDTVLPHVFFLRSRSAAGTDVCPVRLASARQPRLRVLHLFAGMARFFLCLKQDRIVRRKSISNHILHNQHKFSARGRSQPRVQKHTEPTRCRFVNNGDQLNQVKSIQSSQEWQNNVKSVRPGQSNRIKPSNEATPPLKNKNIKFDPSGH